ncbi:MAG: hypothetical protein Q4E05_11080 [Pseudoclavibacter sp.]|nr:hypothetical protein [Pseudoclavibacter sp.]
MLSAVTGGIAVPRCAEGATRMDAARARRLLELALRPLQARGRAAP